jgi:hypothetical protein
MTEAAWLSSTDVRSMLRHLDGSVSMRRMRLFAIACCRRVEYLMTNEDELGRQALDLAETMIDERVNSEEVAATRHSAWYAAFRLIDGFRLEPDLNARSNAVFAAYHTLQEADDLTWHWRGRKNQRRIRSDFMGTPVRAQLAALCAAMTEPLSLTPESKKAEVDVERAQIRILRDIFSNPFRKARIDPSWLEWKESSVGTIAQAIYDERRFDRLPILADALAEAGCNNADILDHCRSSGEHVLGCWVVDLLLGKD